MTIIEKAKKYPPLSPELAEKLEKDREGKKTVALVGFAPNSCAMAPYDNPDVTIWGCNEAYHHKFMVTSDGKDRWDGWFQIHPRWSFDRRNNPNHWNHRLWLRNEEGKCLRCKGTGRLGPNSDKACEECEGGIYRPNRRTDFPIYMQEAYPDIPGAVAFPLKEISERFGVSYFTSSFAYMCALALYQGFDRIEAWGFNMATMTEYQYQKGSTEFWLGIGRGMGKDIYVPPQSQLLKGKLYAYEVSRMISRQDLEFRELALKNERDKVVGELNAIGGARQELEKSFNMTKDKKVKQLMHRRGQEIFQSEINALAKANAIGGRLQEAQDLIKYLDNMDEEGQVGLGKVEEVKPGLSDKIGPQMIIVKEPLGEQ